MDGRIQCEACGTRLVRAAALCPRCAAAFPGGLKGFDDYLKTQHHTLRLAGLVVMWAWMVVSMTAAVAVTGIFFVRLG